MTEKKKNVLSAIKLWALLEGMEEYTNTKSSCNFADSIFKNGEKTVSFITEFDRSKEQLLECLTKNKSGFVYVVTNNNAKRQELIKFIPDYCGILCYGNSFGLSMLYQVLKEPTLIL